MPKTLQCPSCGAPLNDVAAGTTSTRCAYCGNTVFLPDEFGASGSFTTAGLDLPSEQLEALTEIGQLLSTGQKIAAIKIYRTSFGVGLKEAKEAVDSLAAGQPVTISKSATTPQSYPFGPSVIKPKARLNCGAVVGLVIGLVTIIGLVAGFLVFFVVDRQEVIGDSLTEIASEVTPPGFASVASTFGDEGIGPGRFSDARHIAVDGEGIIYVAEWEQGSRVQRFNAAGEFLSQWTLADPEAIVVDLAANRAGIVYVIQGSRLSYYEGSSGEKLGEVSYQDRNSFENLAATPDGQILAYWDGRFDEGGLVRIDSQGRVEPFGKPLAEQTGDFDLDFWLSVDTMTVDGQGNIYTLNTFEDAVFKFDSNGNFVDRFGGTGDAPGQFRSPDDIVTDGRGRVYISEGRDIFVFSPDGTYLDQFSYREHGVASGLAFNDQDELFVAARTKIIKFTLNE